MKYIERCDKRLDGQLAFTPDKVADGKLIKFIEVLRENGCEMRIWTDGYCWIVDYLCDATTRDGTNFQAINYDEDCVVDGKYVDWEAMNADGNE